MSNPLRALLLGDSHLARIRADLPLLGAGVINAAVGGSSVRDLLGQLPVGRSDREGGDCEREGSRVVLVVSIGTNDAAPWKQVPLDEFEARLAGIVRSRPAASWVLVTPPGVIESRLRRDRDRTNAVMGDYREAAMRAFALTGGPVVRTERLIAGLGDEAFVGDGVHLSAAGYAVVLPAIRQALDTATRAR